MRRVMALSVPGRSALTIVRTPAAMNSHEAVLAAHVELTTPHRHRADPVEAWIARSVTKRGLAN
jgi:hypothetical protein